MPRDRSGRERTELPSTLERSEQHAQDTWREAHDSAAASYGDGERAHRIAFAALKHSYKKAGDRWVRKARRGPSDAQAARGPDTPVTSTDPHRAPTRGGAVETGGHSRAELYEEARRLAIPGRSRMSKEALAVAVRERRAR
jgi:cation transport regulator ChaB